MTETGDKQAIANLHNNIAMKANLFNMPYGHSITITSGSIETGTLDTHFTHVPGGWVVVVAHTHTPIFVAEKACML